MKTIIKIELTDEQRNVLAAAIDGKSSKRMVSRKEVVAICEQHIGGLIHATPREDLPLKKEVLARQSHCDLYDVDPADRALMAQPENPGYVRGWNTVKRGAA